MVGVGWLVVMDDWLGRGGPLGAVLGFAIGGVLLLPVGYVYGQWVQRLPDAAGEAAYAAQVFPPVVSYFTGWMMLLAYFIVCPWEAVAVGKLAAYLFPSLNSIELYRIAGHPVFLPRLVLGLALTIFIALLNYRGVRASAVFQKFSAGSVLVLFLVILAASVAHGSPANFHPAFSATPLVSIFLTLQIVPYFMTGFESVPKAAEESFPDLKPGDFPARFFWPCWSARDFTCWSPQRSPTSRPGRACSANRSRPRWPSSRAPALRGWCASSWPRRCSLCSSASTEISWPPADCCLPLAAAEPSIPHSVKSTKHIPLHPSQSWALQVPQFSACCWETPFLFPSPRSARWRRRADGSWPVCHSGS